MNILDEFFYSDLKTEIDEVRVRVELAVWQTIFEQEIFARSQSFQHAFIDFQLTYETLIWIGNISPI